MKTTHIISNQNEWTFYVGNRPSVLSHLSTPSPTHASSALSRQQHMSCSQQQTRTTPRLSYRMINLRHSSKICHQHGKLAAVLDHIYSALSANFTSTADIVVSFSFSVSTTTINRWHWRATFYLAVKQIQQISGAVHKWASPFVMVSIGWFALV